MMSQLDRGNAQPVEKKKKTILMNFHSMMYPSYKETILIFNSPVV